MPRERTLSIIKPDAVARNVMGEIYQRFEQGGLVVVAAKMIHLTHDQAEHFFSAYQQKPYFNDLLEYMTSGPVMVQVLEGEDAIAVNRQLMGASDMRKARSGTIRGDFAINRRENAIYGSYSANDARQEIRFFFEPVDICPRTR